MSVRMSTPSQSDGHMRSLAIALACASVAAVGTMFVPVSLLEGLMGSTGLSELVPAARAPLGDTARALLAFGTGAFTLAAVLNLLLRPHRMGSHIVADAAAREDGERPARVAVLTALRAKMPWNKGDDDIRELADLPKLRNGDAHPDAPARRPLSASQDLPVVEPSPPERALIVEPAHANDVPAPVEAIDPQLAPMPDSTLVAVVQNNRAAETSPCPAYGQASIAEMVAQLETAFAQRQAKLAELEAVAAQIASQRGLPLADAAPEVITAVIPAGAPEMRDSPFAGRPVLEPARRQEDEVDSALAAALATLQRMNVGGR